jgi:S1/P1 Nuclease
MKKTILAILLAAANAHAWDAGGHMLVGQIAWELCSPETRRAVDAMVATLDNQFNGAQPYNFTTVSCWMDDLRSLPKKDYPWSTWHYVDSEKTEDGRAFKLPEPPHLVWAIEENLKTLRNKQAPADERAKALGMLFHWIGDLHQPLHTTTWNDRGGNGYLISGVHFSDLMPGQIANLHTYWDKSFRFDVREGMVVELWAVPKPGERPKPGEGIIAEETKELMKRFPRATLTELAQPASAEGWAKESHLIACRSAYPPGPHPDNTEAPKISPEFAHATYEIAGRRIVVAGYRMAALLNGIFEAKK